MRTSLFLAALVFTLPLAGAQTDNPVKRELQLFQGNWQAVAIYDVEGQKMADAEVKATRLKVEGDRFTITGSGSTIVGTFRLDPAKTPKAIDAVLRDDAGKETVLPGIYEHTGGIRKSTFAMPDAPRPTSFTPRKGTIGFEWKRIP